MIACIFAMALMLQTTCDAFCLTSYCDDRPSNAALVAPNCHHTGHTGAPAGKSKECAHRKLTGASAIQTKVASTTVSHELAVAPLMLPATAPTHSAVHIAILNVSFFGSRTQTLNLRI